MSVSAVSRALDKLCLQYPDVVRDDIAEMLEVQSLEDIIDYLKDEYKSPRQLSLLDNLCLEYPDAERDDISEILEEEDLKDVKRLLSDIYRQRPPQKVRQEDVEVWRTERNTEKFEKSQMVAEDKWSDWYKYSRSVWKKRTAKRDEEAKERAERAETERIQEKEAAKQRKKQEKQRLNGKVNIYIQEKKDQRYERMLQRAKNRTYQLRRRRATHETDHRASPGRDHPTHVGGKAFERMLQTAKNQERAIERAETPTITTRSTTTSGRTSERTTGTEQKQQEEEAQRELEKKKQAELENKKLKEEKLKEEKIQESLELENKKLKEQRKEQEKEQEKIQESLELENKKLKDLRVRMERARQQDSKTKNNNARCVCGSSKKYKNCCKTGTNLFKAANFKTIEDVREELEKDPNSIDTPIIKTGYTPLYIASLQGRLDVVRELLDATPGATVDIPTKEHKTPLYIASERGYVKVVKALLDHNATVHEETSATKNPLLVAGRDVRDLIIAQLTENLYNAISNRLELSVSSNVLLSLVKVSLQLLIGAGVYVNDIKNDVVGSPPLVVASERGDLSIVQALLDVGADVNKATTRGATPLYIASGKGYIGIAKALLDAGAEVNKETDNECTSLYYASEEGYLAIVKLLISRGADVKKYGNTSLYLACVQGQFAVVDYLISQHSQDVDVNTKMFTKGSTSLIMASERGHLALVKRLIMAGADVDEATTDGATSLYFASEKGHLDVVQYLFSMGADVNQSSNGECSPLFIATQNKKKAVVSYLLLSGARVNKSMIIGASPLIIGTYLGNDECVHELLTRDDINTGLVFLERTALQWTEPGVRAEGWEFLNKSVDEEGRKRCKTEFERKEMRNKIEGWLTPPKTLKAVNWVKQLPVMAKDIEEWQYGSDSSENDIYSLLKELCLTADRGNVAAGMKVVRVAAGMKVVRNLMRACMITWLKPNSSSSSWWDDQIPKTALVIENSLYMISYSFREYCRTAEDYVKNFIGEIKTTNPEENGSTGSTGSPGGNGVRFRF